MTGLMVVMLMCGKCGFSSVGSWSYSRNGYGG